MARKTPDAHDAALREHLVQLLTDSQAHVDLLTAIEDVPAAARGLKPRGAPHTPWELLEHIRIAQWDILEFSRDARHISPEFPDGYWPPTPAPPDDGAWAASVARIRSDLEAMVALVRDPASDLFVRIPHGEGQTLLREALLVADHNAYHLGQLVFALKQQGAWREG